MVDIKDIKNPDFLKDLSIKELRGLSENIREFLIETISKTGGHLSSNLGVIELTIALHKVFESPKDKLIFDVGHQSYTHKILTGRADKMHTIRQYEGLSGFLKRDESIHDVFEAGHSSTSIPAAAGFEYAKKYKDSINRVIPIIGDGALTGGMAFEGINFLGHNRGLNPIIILNDNEMSISENVGFLNKLFNVLRTNSPYMTAKKRTSRLMPKSIHRLKSKVERAVKGFISNSTFFDDLGFSYYGPIDGHDFKELLKYLEIVKKSNKPCVVHVLTKKGNGYSYSEADKSGIWHGVGPFDIKTGEKINKKEKNEHAWSKIISEYMCDFAKKNDDFNIVIPAMIRGCELNKFQDLYPDKIIDVGIAEQLAATMSAGLAINDVKVFLPLYSTFAQRAYDQISHDIARQNLNVVIGVDRAGLVGADGETHHGIYDIPLFRHVPNMTIAMPKDPLEAFSLLNYAFDKHMGPFILRYPRRNCFYDFSEGIISKEIEYGSWEYLNKGIDINIIAYGPIINDINELVKNHNISANVINARYIKPIDKKITKELLNNNLPTIVYEESTVVGGLGSAIFEYAQVSNLKVNNLSIMALPDTFVGQGENSDLLRDYDLDLKSILTKIEELIK